MDQADSGQSTQQSHQAKKTNLPIGKCRNAVKGFTPLLWEQKRHHAFQYQHQAERKYPRGFHRTPVLLFSSTAASGGTLEVLEEFRAGIEHHHVMVVLEAGTIRFQAAIKLVKLRILAKRLGIDA